MPHNNHARTTTRDDDRTGGYQRARPPIEQIAIRRIPPEDIGETLALYDDLIRRAAADDLMAADVRGELEAAPRRDEVRDE